MCLKRSILHWCPRDMGQYRTPQRAGVLGKIGTILFIVPEVTALGLSHVCPPVLRNLLPGPNIHSVPSEAGLNDMLTSKSKNSVSLKKSLHEKVQIISHLRYFFKIIIFFQS